MGDFVFVRLGGLAGEELKRKRIDVVKDIWMVCKSLEVTDSGLDRRETPEGTSQDEKEKKKILSN